MSPDGSKGMKMDRAPTMDDDDCQSPKAIPLEHHLCTNTPHLSKPTPTIPVNVPRTVFQGFLYQPPCCSSPHPLPQIASHQEHSDNLFMIHPWEAEARHTTGSISSGCRPRQKVVGSTQQRFTRAAAVAAFVLLSLTLLRQPRGAIHSTTQFDNLLLLCSTSRVLSFYSTLLIVTCPRTPSTAVAQNPTRYVYSGSG